MIHGKFNYKDKTIKYSFCIIERRKDIIYDSDKEMIYTPAIRYKINGCFFKSYYTFLDNFDDKMKIYYYDELNKTGELKDLIEKKIIEDIEQQRKQQEINKFKKQSKLF